MPNDGKCLLSKKILYSESYAYYDFKGWDIEWIFCFDGEHGADGEYGEARLSNSKNNMTASFLLESGKSQGYSCPYGCLRNGSCQPCPFEFINDGSCDIKYYICNQINYLGCKNSEAVGNCTNPRSNEVCQISIRDQRYGGLNCPSCEIGWDLSPIVYPVDNNDFNQFSVDSCIQPVKDGSCNLPDSFKCKGVLWDVCVNGVGQGKCTNDMESCNIIMSTNCSVTESNSCGAISCDSCDAGWNLPDQPALYDSPSGCMNRPSPFSPDNESFIIPTSVAGGVVFVAVTSAVVTIAACFVYHRYKRQGYQHIEGQ